MQRIFIKNNGPVKEFEMDVNKFNLLIGEQATGKSTIAKSIYFFRTIKTVITNYLIQVCDTNTYNKKSQDGVKFTKAIKKELKDIFIGLFGYSWDLNPKLQMRYFFADGIWIKAELSKDDKGTRLIDIIYSDQLQSQILRLQEDAQVIYRNNHYAKIGTSLALANEERKRNHEGIIREVNEIFRDEQETYYIPAGRSLLTVMSSNRSLMNSATNLDLITERFMMMIDSIREDFSQGVKMAYRHYPIEARNIDIKKLAELVVSIQKGEYYFTRGRESIHIPEDPEHPVAINFASSGQQEVLWLLNFLFVLLLRGERAFVIIEEPEAHIFPALQKTLVEFISMFANLGENTVMITTHSPYVLTVMNNLYYAGILQDSGNSKTVRDAVRQTATDERCIIRKGSLSAYKLLQGRQKAYQSLLDEDGREIRAELIDEVSAAVNELYTMLYNIELDGEE